MNEQRVSDALIYGSLATAVVSLMSLAGGCLVPAMRTASSQRWMHFFISMAVATLSSDAILHIIPQVVGAHGHSHGGHEHHSHSHSHELEHEHEHEHHEDVVEWLTVTEERRNLLRLSIIVISIYSLYFIEFIISARRKYIGQVRGSENEKAADGWSEENNNNEEKERQKEPESELFCGLKTRAIIILLGDGVHNLVDGVAIGASFLISIKLGVITTIAVVCHELPHEIGDLAVLVDSGLSLSKALLLNLLSALTAFLGLFASIAVGRSEEAETMLLSITAGMFLYVAWIDMLAHLKNDSSNSQQHWIVSCLVQLSGFTVGFSLIFAVGWFENLFH